TKCALGCASMALRPFAASVAPLLLALPACLAHDAPVATGESEDELRFRVATVDTSLPDVDAIGYEVDLTVGGEPGAETFRGDVSAMYVATQNLRELALDFDGNVIESVRVGSGLARYRREGARLVVELPSPVAAGRSFTTRIRYRGEVRQADEANPNDFSAFGG